MWLLALCMLLAVGTPPAQPGCPVERMIAYSRDTTPGIPSGNGTSAPHGRRIHTSYFIYLVVGRGTVPSVSGVWLRGTYYAATLERVTPPVVVARDTAVPTGEKDTLVPATSSDVYRLHTGEAHDWSPENGDETELTRSNELVVFVETSGETAYCPVRTIKRLFPSAGM